MLLLAASFVAPVPALAQIAMPDPSLIHGRALPASDLPVGTVTVRVVREAIGNDVPGQEVTFVVSGTSRTAVTDAQGRAQFPNLSPGAQGRAEATVDGEALVSQPIVVPASGGLRVILVAGLKNAAARAEKEAAAAAAAPPVPGSVVLSPNSRILLEFSNDALQVFYILEVVNTARTRVDTGGPLIIDLPEGAGGANILQGSTPTATVSGDRVTVTGPFAPGATSVQVGFTLRYDTADVEFVQRWPVAVEQVTVAVEKLGSVGLASPQFSTVGEVRAESGTPFLLASGPALAAGSTLTMQLTNLPIHSPTPRYIALGLALLILGLGGWAAMSGRVSDPESRQKLIRRRDTLLGELAAIEERGKADSSAAADDPRRARILAELEHIYGELDLTGTGPQGGGRHVAA